MARTTVIKTAFNSGELSPLFEGRVDHVKYGQGLSKSRNLIPTVHGAATRRPGTVFVNALPGTDTTSDRAAVLVPHEISSDESWVYAFDKPGQPVLGFRNRESRYNDINAANPFYGVARGADHKSTLSYAQTGRSIYLADNGVSPCQILTNDGDSISFAPLFPATPDVSSMGDGTPTPYKQNYETPPFQDYGQDKEIVELTDDPVTNYGRLRVYHRLIAKTGTFDNSIGARLVFNPSKDEVKSYANWVSGARVRNGDFLHHQGRWYHIMLSLDTPTATLTTEPLHEFGCMYGKSNNENQMGYIGNGHFSGTIYSDEVALNDRPGYSYVLIKWDHTVAPAFKTGRWAFAAIGTGSKLEDGAAYPDNVAIWRNRLILSAGGKLFCSVAGKYRNFNQYTPSGSVAADRLVALDIPSKKLVAVEWLIPQESLIIGSKVGIFAMSEETMQDPFGPGNSKVDLISTFGSDSVEAVSLDSQILYVARGGKRINRLGRSANGWSVTDLSVIADHLGDSGFTELAWQEEPWKVLWCATGAGQLIGLTWNVDENVYAWHPHQMSEQDHVRALCCIPSPSGTIDDLWLGVQRVTISLPFGVKIRTTMVEYLADAFPVGGDLRDAVYADSAVIYDGARWSGNPLGHTMTLTGGTLWDESEELTLTRTSLLVFPAPDTFGAYLIGQYIRLLQHDFVDGVAIPRLGGEFVDLEVIGFTDATHVTVRPQDVVPESLRTGVFCWQFRRNTFDCSHIQNGRVVDVLADGCITTQATVTAGEITLENHASKVVIGLPCPWIARPMRIELGGEAGTTQSKIKRIDHISARFLETVGCKVGDLETHLDEMQFRKPSNDMNQPVPAYTEDKKIPFNGGNTPSGYVVMVNDQPLPITLVSMVYYVDVE